MWGVNFSVAKRWLQDITETYDIKVVSPASVAKHGELKTDASYALDLEIDEEYETPSQTSTIGIDSQTDDSETGSSFGYKAPELGGTNINGYDNILDPSSRDDFDNAAKTAVAEAKTRIHASHRSNTVVIETLINPTASTSQTLAVNSPEITAKGKVKRVRHVMSNTEGFAFSTIEAAIYQPNVAGQTDDVVAPLTVNTLPDLSPQGLTLNSHFGGRTTTKYNPDWTGYIGNWSTRTYPSEWYPDEFRVDFPEIEEAARDSAEFTDAPIYNVAIPQDTLTINA